MIMRAAVAQTAGELPARALGTLSIRCPLISQLSRGFSWWFGVGEWDRRLVDKTR